MKFDYERWKVVVLGLGDPTIGADDTLEAAGLIDPDYLEDDISSLMREIENELDEAERKAKGGAPDGDTA